MSYASPPCSLNTERFLSLLSVYTGISRLATNTVSGRRSPASDGHTRCQDPGIGKGARGRVKEREEEYGGVLERRTRDASSGSVSLRLACRHRLFLPWPPRHPDLVSLPFSSLRLSSIIIIIFFFLWLFVACIFVLFSFVSLHPPPLPPPFALSSPPLQVNETTSRLLSFFHSQFPFLLSSSGTGDHFVIS